MKRTNGEQASEQASKQASEQASERTRKRASEQTREQASEQASERTSKEASKRASKQASKSEVGGSAWRRGFLKIFNEQDHLAENNRPAENFDEKTRPDFLRRVPEHPGTKSWQNVSKLEKKNKQKKSNQKNHLRSIIC